MRRRHITAGMFMLALCASGSTGHAAVYKWTDPAGHVHFGDRATAADPAAAGVTEVATAHAEQDLDMTIEEHGRPLPPGLRKDAEASIRRVMRVYRQVFGFGLKHTVVVSVHVFDTNAELVDWAEKNSGQRMKYLEGIYIRIQDKQLVGVHNPAGFPQATLQTLVHEVNHAIMAQVAPNAPLWINEGLSVYFEGMDTAADRLTVRSSTQNNALINSMISRGEWMKALGTLALPARRWQEVTAREGDSTPYRVALSLTGFLMSKPMTRHLLGNMLQDLDGSDAVPDLETFAQRYPGGAAMLEQDWNAWAQLPATTQVLE